MKLKTHTYVTLGNSQKARVCKEASRNCTLQIRSIKATDRKGGLVQLAIIMRISCAFEVGSGVEYSYFIVFLLVSYLVLPVLNMLYNIHK